MLGDELYVCGASLAECIADIGFNVFAKISKVLRNVTSDHMKRAGADHFVPLSAGFINVFHKIGILPDGVSNNAHRISLIG